MSTQRVFHRPDHPSTHGFCVRAEVKDWSWRTTVPSKFHLGRLLLQSPGKTRWTFPSGATGTHNPALRRRIQEAKGE